MTAPLAIDFSLDLVLGGGYETRWSNFAKQKASLRRATKAMDTNSMSVEAGAKHKVNDDH